LTRINAEDRGGRIFAAMLIMPREKLAYIVVKAREFDALVEPEGLEGGSNPSDDREVGILEATGDNPTLIELRSALEDLNDDEMAELLALVWLGRGDYARAEWKDALASAREARDKRAVPYLLETPNLGDLLEQGLAELDISVIDEEGRL
jgi:hypothetical protein